MSCTNPITQEDRTFACRVCDGCISARRFGWVARAMAEKAMNPYTVLLTLTYSDETQEGRDGARMFCYRDVANWLKRVRTYARYAAKRNKSNITPSVRFICAGEQGDRNGRCHWHVILYTNFDLSKLGTYLHNGKQVTELEHMLTKGKVKRRLNWSIWPLGYMTFQIPDQSGLNYALSYCLKDQFTQAKSQGTMREAKSENFATGLFRMSKRPAIGEAYLIQEMERLDATGSVLPSLSLYVPDLKIRGKAVKWEPTGSFRKKLLWHLVALNKRALWATGANAPQWSSLLSSCSHNQTDLDIFNGTLTEKELDPQDDDFESIETEMAFRSRETGQRQSISAFARFCARSVPCSDCLHGWTQGALSTLNVERYEDRNGLDQYRTIGKAQLETVALPHVNPFCLNKGSKTARLAAPVTGRAGAGNHFGRKPL